MRNPSQTYEASLQYGITQCYLPPDTGQYSIYLPQMDRRLSWPWYWSYAEMA